MTTLNSFICNILCENLPVFSVCECRVDAIFGFWMTTFNAFVFNVLGERIDGLEQEAVDPLENLEDLELDFLDEDILECDNMRGLIQVIFYTENKIQLNILTISYTRCVYLVIIIGTPVSGRIFSCNPDNKVYSTYIYRKECWYKNAAYLYLSTHFKNQHFRCTGNIIFNTNVFFGYKMIRLHRLL
jgi:hypothetical protein